MIMHILQATQPAQSVEVPSKGAMDVIRDLVSRGVEVYTSTFTDREGDTVTVFWSDGPDDHVATVWEHTYFALVVPTPDADITVARVTI